VIVLASLVGYAMPLSLLTAVEAMAMPATARHSSARNDHSCCPDHHSRITSVVFLTLDPALMPCGGQHPCCAHRAPDNLPSLPAANRQTATDLGAMSVAVAGHLRRRPVAEAWTGHTFELYGLRTTVLRI